MSARVQAAPLFALLPVSSAGARLVSLTALCSGVWGVPEAGLDDAVSNAFPDAGLCGVWDMALRLVAGAWLARVALAGPGCFGWLGMALVARGAWPGFGWQCVCCVVCRRCDACWPCVPAHWQNGANICQSHTTGKDARTRLQGPQGLRGLPDTWGVWLWGTVLTRGTQGTPWPA